MATLQLAQTGFIWGRNFDVPAWKRGSNMKLSTAFHYFRKTLWKSPHLCKSMFPIRTYDFKRLLGSRDQDSTKTRLTQKLQWIALKLLLMKAEIDKSKQVDIICAIKCDYLVITVIMWPRWHEREADTKAHRNKRWLGYFTKMKKF